MDKEQSSFCHFSKIFIYFPFINYTCIVYFVMMPITFMSLSAKIRTRPLNLNVFSLVHLNHRSEVLAMLELGMVCLPSDDWTPSGKGTLHKRCAAVHTFHTSRLGTISLTAAGSAAARWPRWPNEGGSRVAPWVKWGWDPQRREMISLSVHYSYKLDYLHNW